jgi:hypothetical protein
VVGSSLEQSLEAKRESAEQRLRLRSYVEMPDSVESWLIGSSRPNQIESAAGNWFAATGLLGIGLFATWLWLALRRIRRPQPAAWVLPVTAGFLVSSLFVPHLVVFPMGGLFVLAVSLASSYSERIGN